MKIKFIALIAAALAFTSLTSTAQAAPKSCSLTQAIEEGPYYLSNTPTRKDVTDGQQGKAMEYSFTVLDSSCKPIKGARIDIWYANAQGVYSGVATRGDDLGAGKNSGNFLRGTQFTNAKGVATFKGIYPGWYPARTVHIHQKIWVNSKEVLTTQTFFTDKQNAAVMATSPYNQRGVQRVTNGTDGVLNRGGVDLEAAFMKVKGSKASATFVVAQ